MHHLPADTARLLSSAQVITSVYSVVKELVENSVDANADSIEVKLENFGLDRVEVRDNGDGIAPEDTEYMGQRHYTSKLREFNDLSSVMSYGFRGEALGSLCSVADVSITTKRESDPISKVYTLNHQGGVVFTKPSHLGKGTTVSATHLFKNVPVRKQYYSNAKRRKEELKRVEDLLMCYGVVKPEIRFSLSHNKSNVWQKNQMKATKNALLNTLGSSIMSQMEVVEGDDPSTQIKVEGFIPKPDSDIQLVARSQNDRTWFVINSRPVQFKEAEKLVKQYFCRCHDNTNKSIRHLVTFLHFTLPLDCVDVNVEPNKTKVILQNNESVLSLLIQVLEGVYPNKPSETHQQLPLSLPNTETYDVKTTYSCQTTSSKQDDNSIQITEIDNEKLVFNEKDPQNNNEKFLQNIDNEKDSIGVTSKFVQSEKDDAIRDRTERCKPLNVDREIEIEPTQEPNFTLFDDDLLLDTQPTILNKELDICPQLIDKEKELPEGGEPEEVEKREENPRLFGDLTEKIDHSLSKQDWSKGVGVLNSVQNEPVKLLVPGSTIITNRTSTDAVCNNSNLVCSNGPSVNSINTNNVESSMDPIRTSEVTLNTFLPTKCLNNKTSISNLPKNSNGLFSGSPTRKINSPPEKGSPGRYKKSFEEKCVSPGDLYDLLGETPVRRAQEPFDYFVKVMQPLVAKDNPNADAGTVQLLLEEGWEQMTEEERNKYENIAEKDRNKYATHLTAAQNSANLKRRSSDEAAPRKKKKVIPAPNQGRLDQMFLSQERRGGVHQRPEEQKAVQETEIQFSIDVLRHPIQPQTRSFDDKLHLIGPLPSFHVWLAVEDNSVVVLNINRAEEAILYKRLISSHVLATKPLDLPIVLDSSLVGGEDNWLTLLSLESQISSQEDVRYFTDKRLTSNGFILRQLMDEDTTNMRIEVTSMSNTIQFFGLPDLVEILNLVTNKMNIHLSECRPLKVQNYLKSEAVRIARSRPKDTQPEDVLEIMSTLRGAFQEDQQVCVHKKPIIHKLCTLKGSS